MSDNPGDKILLAAVFEVLAKISPKPFHISKLLKINRITTKNYNKDEKVNRNRDDATRRGDGRVRRPKAKIY